MKRNADGLIINNNINEFQRYKMERSKVVRQKSLEERVHRLESELAEMKQLLQSLNVG